MQLSGALNATLAGNLFQLSNTFLVLSKFFVLAGFYKIGTRCLLLDQRARPLVASGSSNNRVKANYMHILSPKHNNK